MIPLPLVLTLVLQGTTPKAEQDDDTKDLPVQDLRCGKNEKQRYFLIGPRKEAKTPKDGFGLLVVMPGGDGSAEFHPFVKNIALHGAGDSFLTAQLVSVKWKPDQTIIWPTKGNPVPKMEFTTEEFAEAVIAEGRKTQKIDPERIYTLSWSSSGPAAYAISLREKTPVRGSFIAMSVFHPNELGSLKSAAGRAYYLLHSPEDKTCPFRDSEEALKALEKAGAKATLEKYEGGHGWNGPVFPMIKKGLAWLDESRKKK